MISGRNNSIDASVRRVSGQEAIVTSQSFLPKMLLEKLKVRDNGGIRLTGNSNFFEGICLIVDISGFTRLSGQYCARGKDGIDGLQKATNGFIGMLVEIIYAHGGDIIKFAGDAIICVFLSETSETTVTESINVVKEFSFTGNIQQEQEDTMKNSSSAKNTPKRISGGKSFSRMLRNSFINRSQEKDSESEKTISISDADKVPNNALQCAMKLSKKQTDQLSVHVGLSTGEMCFAMVGGYKHQWECLISGECIFHISNCLDDASSKQTVISPQFMKLLSTSYQENMSTTLLESGNYLINSIPKVNGLFPDLDIHQITKRFMQADKILTASYFVPIPVLHNLKTEQFQVIAEVREVTTMFMKWESYDWLLHRDLLALQDRFYAAQEILFKAGAFIRQFLVDDKGCVLIACWGVPTSSYLDNAFRALEAAILLRDKLRSMEMKCSFGITTGNVYCGTVGNETRREYAAIGDVVNLAARLMGKANGEILIDEATFFRLPFDVVPLLDRLPAVTVKGKTEPIPIFGCTATELPHTSVVSEGEFEIRHMHKLMLRRVLDVVSPPPKIGMSLARTLSRTFSKQFSFSNSGKAPILRKNSSQGSLASFFTGASTGPKLRTVLLEGKEGSGKGTLISWFKKECTQRGAKVIYLELSNKDNLFEYRAIAKLFRLLVGERSFDSDELQTEMVTDLLNGMYDDDDSTLIHKRTTIKVLRIVLGVTVDIKLKPIKIVRGLSKRRVGFNDNDSIILTPKKIAEQLRKIFEYLFNEDFIVVIIDKMYYADEESLNAFSNIRLVSAKAILLMSSLDEDDIKTLRVLKDKMKNIKGAMSLSSIAAHAKGLHAYVMLNFRKNLLHSSGITHVVLKFLTEVEIETILSSALQIGTIPVGLPGLVHHISGGMPFWVKEMIEFIRTTGPTEFITSMDANIHAPLDSAPLRGNQIPFFTSDGRVVLNGSDGTSNAAGKHHHRHTAEIITGLGGAASLERVVSSSMLSDGGKENNKMDKSKLELFIVCRFEKLAPNEKRILKIASLIGYRFLLPILKGVLPRLSGIVDDVIPNLLKSHWIAQSSQDEKTFKFTHSLVYNTLYELTPLSDRKEAHREIAEFIESEYSEDPTYHLLLSKQFRHCDLKKALEYGTKGLLYMLDLDSFDAAEGLALFHMMIPYCQNATDVEMMMKLIMKLQGAIRSHKTAAMDRKRGLAGSFSISTKLSRVSDIMSESFSLSNCICGGKLTEDSTSFKSGLAYRSRVLPIENSMKIQSNSTDFATFQGTNALLSEESATADAANFAGLLKIGKKKSFKTLNSSMSVKAVTQVSRKVGEVEIQLDSMRNHFITLNQLGEPEPWQIPILGRPVGHKSTPNPPSSVRSNSSALSRIFGRNK